MLKSFINLLFICLLTDALPRERRQEGCNEGELRISEGTPNHGYLEYCLNNEFGIVCGDSFDNKDAQVACRQLGYAGANATGVGEFRGRPDEAKMYLSNIQCNGDEKFLSKCPVPGGPESGIVWSSKVYCSWRLGITSSDYLWDYKIARINCAVPTPTPASCPTQQQQACPTPDAVTTTVWIPNPSPTTCVQTLTVTKEITPTSVAPASTPLPKLTVNKGSSSLKETSNCT